MNQQERIVAVFEGKKPEVMPWFADLTYWYKAKMYRNELPTKYLGERGKIRLYRHLGCGSHEDVISSPGDLTYRGVKRVSSVEPFADGTIVFEEEYKTPIGDILAITKFMPTSVSTPIVKYPVETRQDLRILQYIYKNQTFKPDYSLQYDRLKNWEGIGLVSSWPVSRASPFQDLIGKWAGVMNTMRLLMRESEEIDETIQIMTECDDQIWEAIRESPAPGVYVAENLSSEVISPPLFRKYYLPFYKRRAQQLRSAPSRKFSFLHIDGTLRGLLGLLGETGVDCAQSITPAPVGDLPIDKLREVAGPNIILWGGLPGVYFSSLYARKNLHQMALDVMRYHLIGHKFIMGVADQVPPDGDISRVMMITKLVEKYGKYD